MRGATIFSTRSAHWRTHFNPRSSCEERLVEAAMMRDASMISIHAPHARSDACQPGKDYSQVGFQSTLLMRGATIFDDAEPLIAKFQSTLLMRGATPVNPEKITVKWDFNPRSSCEERPFSTMLSPSLPNFNPRSSCEERRGILRFLQTDYAISIHAPHARSDSVKSSSVCCPNISIHAPHARSDILKRSLSTRVR